VVLVTFGWVSLFTVTELHRNRLEIRLGFLQLSQDAAKLETFLPHEKDTERLLEELRVESCRVFMRLARLYFPPFMAHGGPVEGARHPARGPHRGCVRAGVPRLRAGAHARAATHVDPDRHRAARSSSSGRGQWGGFSESGTSLCDEVGWHAVAVLLHTRSPVPAPRLSDLSASALLWRRSKQALLQANRLVRWTVTPERWPEPALASAGTQRVLLASHVVALSRIDDGADPVLEAGKRHNVRLAAPAFDGLLLAPDRPLSFWRTVGRLSAAAGYRHGLSLRGGCLTPSLGGGVCLLANALFELAARQGWHVRERHGHTLEAVPPEAGALWGMDATVAWPYVDLVVAPREGSVRLGARVVGDTLRLTLHGAAAPRTRSVLWSEDDNLTNGPEGPVRTNRVLRRVEDLATGAVLEEGVIAHNRRRVLNPEAVKRTCRTCGETACYARVAVPAAEVRSA